jgi:phospholipase C
MYTRREFVKTAALLTGGTSLWSALPASIQRALAIEPESGSSYLDAEHVVILMQENRSFDHAFGTLQGVRGFNDPRAIRLPNGNPVWVQTNPAGESYIPFRLNIKETKATWMGSLPHTWPDQVDARNHGKFDRWLEVKQSADTQYAAMPLTLGHYIRDDIPSYYALADAFTICDQHFCSSLTGTTPNRLFLWTGTIRAKQSADSLANVWNDQVDHGAPAHWTTFPERLEEHGISWKVYQNEVGVPTGLNGDEEAWLANFVDNPLEYFPQFGVWFVETHRRFLDQQAAALAAELDSLQKQAESTEDKAKLEQHINEKTAALARNKRDRNRSSQENFDQLSAREKSLHARAFCTNSGDPDYRQLATLSYDEAGTQREMQIPRGDLLHQFREDCRSGNLPAVSWIVAPERFSDHPCSAWFGAWYMSEVLDILTRNPEVWKKTIFLLTYDENDGYFDHVPPFVAPHPTRPETGLTSKGIDTAVEYVELEQNFKRKPPAEARESPIGLGYRVPLIIASPWSRGGCVCSQVFDHTSSLQFLEHFFSHKTGTKVEEPNISQWRRTICGDLTSTFQPAAEGKDSALPFLSRDEFVEQIHRAQFKQVPSDFAPLTKPEIGLLQHSPSNFPRMPEQEPGIRCSCALPYELVAEGGLNKDRTHFEIRFEARNEVFGDRAAGSPFTVYASTKADDFQVRNYAVAAGDNVKDSWSLDDFANGKYHLRIYGPNGFYREFRGSHDDPAVDVKLSYRRTGTPALNTNCEFQFVNRDNRQSRSIEIRDNAYNSSDQKTSIEPGANASVVVDIRKSFGWYDLTVQVQGADDFIYQYAGRIETGNSSYSDPLMGRIS